MKLRLAFCIAALATTLAPAMAQNSVRALAPADEYFGRFNLSVLGIANTIRDAGARMDSGTDPRTMLSGPLTFVTDAVKDWEQKYPADPWIAEAICWRLKPCTCACRATTGTASRRKPKAYD